MDAPVPAAPGEPRRLTIGPILRLAWRSLGYLKGARRELGLLALIALSLLLLAIPVSWILYELVNTRMLQGRPLSAFEANLLSLPFEEYVEVDSLSVASRQVLRNKLMLFVAGVVVVFAPIAVAVLMYWVRLQQRINQGIRVKMMEQVQAMSLRFHSGAQVGDAIYRTYQDSAMITSLMAMLVRPVVPMIFLIMGLLAMIALDKRTALFLVAVYLIGAALAFWYGRRLRVSFRTAREVNSALTSQIQETMAAIKVVKAFGTEPVEQARFERSSNAAFEAAYRARMQMATFGLLAFVLSALPAMSAATYMAVWANKGLPVATTASIAAVSAVWTLGVYQWATGRVAWGSRSLNSLLRLWGELQNAGVGMDRAFAQVDLDPEVKDQPGAKDFAGIEREISFEGVTFGYERAHPVLHEVSLRAQAGEITALCGPTGSGKSTLVSLLLRLFEIDHGKIAIDGNDIRGFRVDSLRAGVAIALQENLLFGTTIAENIRYARPNASEAEVREAARIACALEFIEALPLGFDTPLGERGSKLSTGQRQRLSIARAIIKDAPVLVLDEPTASLDAETELRVLQNLAEWAKGRAVLLITHRLSTIRRADKIVYLRDGRVVETGAPDELVARPGGAYRRFVELEREAGQAALQMEQSA